MDAYNKETNQMILKNQIEVMQAYLRGAPIQSCHLTQNPSEDASWTATVNPNWNWGALRYRVKPEVVTYDTMDWTNIHERYQYVARDFNGTVYLYMLAPEIKGYRWYPGDAHKDYVEVPSIFTGHKPGNCDWKHSLIKRDFDD